MRQGERRQRVYRRHANNNHDHGRHVYGHFGHRQHEHKRHDDNNHDHGRHIYGHFDHRQRGHKRHNPLLGVLSLLAAYCAAFAVAYGITTLIYRFVGNPPEIFRHSITGVVTVAVIMTAWRIILGAHGGAWHEDYQSVHNQVIDALAQVAQGNFNVLLDRNTFGWDNNLSEAFNEMARSLGTLETMRQDFISNVSHEIQSPLTSISGFAALLQTDDLPDDERRRYASVIETESRRLSSLSDNLLKLSSLDSDKIPLNKTTFRLDKQLENAALTLEPQWAAKNLKLEADLQKLTVCCDEDLMSQVWMNLLHNAIKFTPEGGRINLLLTVENETAVVKISDTGAGIRPEDQIHIFERFFKADKARDRALGGNGLGLSLVKKIVELHDGRITVESEVDIGTVFTILFPIKNPRPSE